MEIQEIQHYRKKYLWLGFKITLIILAIILLPYFGYAIWILGGSIAHQIQWQVKGSPSYIIKSELNDFSPIRGVNIVTVKHGRIVSVVVENAQFPEDQHDLQDYKELTIDGMFQKTYLCMSSFPRLLCSFKYNIDYGYPTKIEINCSNPDMCSEIIDVMDVNILEQEK